SSLELRNEAIASLAVTDVRFSDVQELPDPALQCYDAAFRWRARENNDGSLSVRRIGDNSEVARLPSVGARIERLHGFSPGAHYLGVKYFGRRTIVWEIETRQPAIDDTSAGIAADFGSDEQTFALSCPDGELRR